MSVDVTFTKGLAKQLRLVRKAIKIGGVKGLAATTAKGKTAVIESMEGPKTGIMYGDHQASAPGETPAIDTGELAAGIKTKTVKSKLTSNLISSDKKSAGLEFGTLRVAPRPFMMPTSGFMATILRDEVEKGIVDEMNRTIK